MRLKGGPWGIVVGIVLGFSIGSVSVATAMLGYKGWQRFSDDFKVGYLTGFFDMSNLARNLDPDGYIDEHFPLWPNVKVREWRELIDELYRKPENQQYGMFGMVQLAGQELKKKHGAPPKVAERLAPALQEQVERARKAEQAATPRKPAVAGAKSQAPKTPAAPRPNPWAHKKKWCRCPEAATESKDAGNSSGEQAGTNKGADQASKAGAPVQPATSPSGDSAKTPEEPRPEKK